MSTPKHPEGLPPIVVADDHAAMPLLRQHLPAGFGLAHAPTFDAARALVKAETPLVLCGCHFDDGRMYDLLRWMRASPPLKHVPFLAVRLLEGQLDDAMYESVKIAIDAVGGDGFIDLYRWQLRYGEQAAGGRLARRVDALLHGEDAGDSV
ncbi:hypothetical protein [Ramlibacter algicola]|uniref:Uncharacterized protein n=1 Tax=Ramlibacter algicola TaxID=2795217 RepID=A0A934UST2_9BURK|nr:hypothetical protein [Ramlibacter algicola]MBK0393817.1 hypothetical protein [Ramlibacter algicola]